MSDKVTFSFGKNWCDYLTTVTDDEIASAKQDLIGWLGEDAFAGKSVIDIGSGSGIHSLSMHRLGVKDLLSVDVDPHSITATTTLWEREGRPENWRVKHGSILDGGFVDHAGSFDIVYSWGVLHHTGEMWRAIENASTLVKPGGVFWISLYQKGSRYAKDLALKKKYNAASESGKRWMVRSWIAKDMWRHIKRFKNPFRWFSKSARGMNKYHDLIDWLGGLPYEVAHENEIIQFGLERGLVLEKIRVVREGGCSIYVLRHVPGLAETRRQSQSRSAA